MKESKDETIKCIENNKRERKIDSNNGDEDEDYDNDKYSSNDNSNVGEKRLEKQKRGYRKDIKRKRKIRISRKLEERNKEEEVQ